MKERLDELVQALMDCTPRDTESGDPGDCAFPTDDACRLSDGERRYVALASGVETLLSGYESAIEAWYALPPHWRAAVCRWRGWPEGWAAPLPSERQDVGERVCQRCGDES